MDARRNFSIYLLAEVFSGLLTEGSFSIATSESLRSEFGGDILKVFHIDEPDLKLKYFDEFVMFWCPHSGPNCTSCLFIVL